LKLLLDESAPRRLAASFPDAVDVRTVPQMGWAGSTNGELLRLASGGGFDALVTVDRGFEYQQNLSSLPIAVVILVAARNRLQELEPLVPGVVEVLSGQLLPGIYRVPS